MRKPARGECLKKSLDSLRVPYNRQLLALCILQCADFAPFRAFLDSFIEFPVHLMSKRDRV